MQTAEAAAEAPTPAKELTIEERFEKASVDVSLLSKRPSDETMLALYGYYKQAKEGDCSTPKPGVWDPKGRYKWDSWNKLLGMSKEAAMQGYIDVVEELKRK